MRPRRLLFFAAALLTAALSRPSSLHAQSDVIRGRIIGPDSVPIERASVTVTSLNGSITRMARTDKAGRYTITFPGDEGDYMVNVAALGFAAKRFEISAREETFSWPTRIIAIRTQLDAVKVQAARDKPLRTTCGLASAGASAGQLFGASATNWRSRRVGCIAPRRAVHPGADGAPGGSRCSA